MLVGGLAPANRLASIGSRRNDGLGWNGCDLLSQCHGVIGFVGHNALGWHAVEQRAGLGNA